MASKTLSFLYLFLLFFLQLRFSSAQNVVKSGYWFPESEFPLSNINASLFTHLFCAFANLSTQTNQVTISRSNLPSFSNFTKTLRLKNPNIKTLLSIGGGSVPSSTFAPMASQASSRKTFIDSSIRLARTYNFSGLNLAWLHQNMTSELANMGLLLDEWRSALTNESKTTGLAPLKLTAALAYTPQIDSLNYPIPSLIRNLDWINVMAYDFYAPDPNWSNVTRSHAALYDPPTNKSSASYGINAWIEAGVPTKNLVLGFPFYGYVWRLINPNNHGLFASANGTDTSVVAADSEGAIRYNDIKTFISENNATTVFNATVVTNYCYSGTTWIGYDDIQTISAKVKYAKEKGLLGYFAWHVGADDNNWALSQQAYAEYQEDPHPHNRPYLLVKILLPIAVIILLLGFVMCYIKRRVFKSRGAERPVAEDFNSNDPNLQVFSFATIKAATSKFSGENKLGEGGYGPVYKGKLPKGQKIAVKRLSETSHQGLEEFENEVTLTAKLQHVNLVRVLGYCTEKKEKMLIYEYMPNKSLDFYLFDLIRQRQLDWRQRIHIIEGVTQGLLYLQEYSNFTIIHRDIKGSNILLDSEMNAKISDFGMAKIFSKDGHEANTGRIVGTYGYVPPEYVRNGIYSMKYDVYSFGVLHLQIISGKKNTYLYGLHENLNLLDYAHELWKEGRGMEFFDPSLDDSSSSCKLDRCLQIALLCVQEDPVDRPSMLEVYSMLKNEATVMATPKRPAFSIKIDEGKSSIPHEEICSANNVSLSQMLPR